MELAHSLLLNEDALKRISESKRPVFIFEWLRFLDKVLVAAQKSDIKESQPKLIRQLTQQISEDPGPPTRKILARCLATVFSVGDTFSLFETIGKCNDIIKNKDDSPSYLPTRLAAVACIGGMYEKLGRMVGRSYEETVLFLIKALKNAESQGRCEIMLTLQKVVAGLGSAGSNCYKDIYKASKGCMTDRAMTVRSAAAKCMMELVGQAPFIYTNDLDSMVSLCFRTMDGSNYDVRCDTAKLLGALLAMTQSQTKTANVYKGKQLPKIDEVLNMLANGFIKGGSGFLKGSSAGEMIKGTGSVNREIRVGVTHAYVELVECLGSLWLERNLALVLNHVLYLVANPKATPTHVDAVYARKCVQFILRQVIGGLLGEKAQIAAAKEICQIIIKEVNTVDAGVDGERSVNSDNLSSQHVLVCALQELGSLVSTLGTSASPLVSEPASGILEPVVSVLIHPNASARLAAAWCLRCISVALPSQLAPLLQRSMNRMNQLKSSPEAVAGYSCALAALLGGVSHVSLGIPHAMGKQIFNIAEELLRSATQNSRLSLQRTQSGWLLLGALMTLGPPVVKSHLPRMLLLWRNAFPRSSKELESEKARGDAFTWQVTLEGRAGALGAMHSFVTNCRDILTEEVIRRLLPPLECALTMLAHMTSVIKMYGTHLKASAAMVRLRLYDVLTLLPPEMYEGAFNSLLRELVAEFTLTDNAANTTTSLLRSLCHVDDSVILGSWLQETDHKAIEDQLQPNSASGSGALEHDAAALYLRCSSGDIPGPLPLGVAVIDSSVKLYGLVFPKVAHKHRLQMLDHFSECIKQAKSQRQQAVQINIFTAVLCALKSLAETKTGFGQLDVRKAAITLVLGALGSTNPILRCAGGEALGRMAQVVGDPKFIAEMAQYSFDRLKSARDVVRRTGHSLSLGCLHRYVGGMGSGQHLNTSVSILLALAQDSTSPVVQVWALHALGLIADSGGPMFRGYVEPTLSLVLTQLLTVPPFSVDVHQCLGKCLAALITTIGPELQGNSGAIATARLSCLVCCAIMQDHPDSMVQAEAISCLQQLHLFAPRHVNLTTLVPHLCDILYSPHLLLRRAAVSCLRQLAQREAREISEHALSLVLENKEKTNMTESGLEGALFAMLDTEWDRKLCSDIQDTLVSMLHALAADNLSRWLTQLKGILLASTDSSSGLPTPDHEEATKDLDSDDASLHVKGSNEDVTHPQVAPRWPTRVFAIKCVLRILSVCEQDEHYDLLLAKEMRDQNKGDFLVLHLSELVRMAFIAATSDSDKLRLAGLKALQNIISKFCNIQEPEFPGHVILEQYQAQVGAALRPAFTPETAPDVTASACDVCSAWIGSGVARDLNDLRRVHQLLVSSLGKLKDGKHATPIYSESASTMEKLAVLKAWAEVYIVAVEKEKKHASTPDNNDRMNGYTGSSTGGESLQSLVQPEMASLSRHWLAALKDHALLSLPPELSSQLPPEGGAFFTPDTMEASRPYYKKSWAPILYAASLWLMETGFTTAGKGKEAADAPANMKPADRSDSDRFHLLMGIAMEAMCSPTSIQPLENVMKCLKAIYTLLDDSWPRRKLGSDKALGIELLNVMHRIILTRDDTACHIKVVDVVRQVLKAAQESLDEQRSAALEARAQAGEDIPTSNDPDFLGEGGEKGDIIPGKSLVFATLEVCLCALIRHIPGLNPSMPSTGFQLPVTQIWSKEDACQLVSAVLLVLADLPALCSPRGSVSIVPTLLFLITGIIKQLAPKSSDAPTASPVTTALQALKLLCSSSFTKNSHSSDAWIKLLQSALVTVLNSSKPDPEKDVAGIDDNVMLLFTAVFITTCPKEVVSVTAIKRPCTEMFKKAWDNENLQLRLKCIQTLISICQHPDLDVSTPYIHAVAPSVMQYLLQIQENKPSSDIELAIALEAIKLLESLVALTEESKRMNMVALLVPVLVSLLLDSSTLSKSVKIHRLLHEQCLSKLMKIGPKYPTQFKTIMQKLPDLRQRLEAAVKAQQDSTSTRSSAASQAFEKVTAASKPTIQLKTDFSNF